MFVRDHKLPSWGNIVLQTSNNCVWLHSCLLQAITIYIWTPESCWYFS